MSDTINIASSLPLPMRIMEPFPNPEKPGDAGPLKSAIIGAGGHRTASGMTVTRGVDADLYRKWSEANPHHPALLGEHFRKVSDDEIDNLENPEILFGFEPGLEAGIAAMKEAAPARMKKVEHKEGAQDESVPPAADGARLTVDHKPGAATEPPQGGMAPTNGGVHGEGGMSDAELEHATRPDPAK